LEDCSTILGVEQTIYNVEVGLQKLRPNVFYHFNRPDFVVKHFGYGLLSIVAK